MILSIHIADIVLTEFSEYIEAIQPDQLELTFSKDELNTACSILILFDLITNEGKGLDNFNKYKITEIGKIVSSNNGGLKKYLDEMNYRNLNTSS